MNTGPKATMSTAEAGRLIGVSPKTVVAMYRNNTNPISGYPVRTRTAGRIHAIRIYVDSVAEYQRRQERGTPLKNKDY